MMFQNLRRCMSETDTLKLRCCRTGCGHVGEWNREQAFFIFGPDAAPYDISKRSRCGQCGERNAIHVYI
jgi:hypothetical protein